MPRADAGSTHGYCHTCVCADVHSVCVGVYDYKKQQDCSFTYLHQELLDQVKTEGKVKHGHVYVGGREKERERESVYAARYTT